MSKSKRKGTDWEMEVLRYLGASGFTVGRMPPAGRADVGDLHIYVNDFRVVVECKAVRELALAEWMQELGVEVAHTQETATQEVLGVVVHKRKMKGVAQGYVTMDLSTFVDLLTHTL